MELVDGAEWRRHSNTAWWNARIAQKAYRIAVTFCRMPKEHPKSNPIRLRFRYTAQTPYRPSIREFHDHVPIRRTCFALNSPLTRKDIFKFTERHVDRVSIMRQAFPLSTPQKTLPVPEQHEHVGLDDSPSGSIQCESHPSTLASSQEDIVPVDDHHSQTHDNSVSVPPISLIPPSSTQNESRPSRQVAGRRDTDVDERHSQLSDDTLRSVLPISLISTIPAHTPPTQSTPSNSPPQSCATLLPDGLSADTATSLSTPGTLVPTRTSLKIRGVDHHFVIFHSSGDQELEAPTPELFSRPGDVYLHQHSTTTQLWVRETCNWVPGGAAHQHPFLQDHRLHFVSPGQPRWVHKKTLTTYRGREKKKD